MKKSIIKRKVRELVKDKPVRMHMPGHKGKRREFRLDITEIDGADNLHNPKGIIQKVQDKIAQIYGAGHSFLLVDGSTVGVQASVMSAVGEDKKILIPTNAHRSVYPALGFSRAKPVYYQPQISENGMTVTPGMVAELIEEHPDAKALMIVSPDYYGNISDLREIAKTLEGTDIALIVDEAHGAHLSFLPEKLDGVSAGADYVVQSTHKILGAPTQGSILHISDQVDERRVSKTLTLLESSSPSYILMSGIEEAVDEANEKAKRVFERIYHAHDALAKKQSEEDPFFLITPDGLYDKSKFLFSYPAGYPIRERLVKDLRIIPELIGPESVLFMTGIGTSQRDLNRLFGTADILNKEMREKRFTPSGATQSIESLTQPFQADLELHEVLGKSGEFVELDNAAGRVALEFIVPYPPGVPYLIPGVRISEESLRVLEDMVKKNVSINGLVFKNGKPIIEVLRESDEDNSNRRD